MRLQFERVTLSFTNINTGATEESRQWDISLWDGEDWVDNVVIDKDDLLWLLESDE